MCVNVSQRGLVASGRKSSLCTVSHEDICIARLAGRAGSAVLLGVAYPLFGRSLVGHLYIDRHF